MVRISLNRNIEINCDSVDEAIKLLILLSSDSQISNTSQSEFITIKNPVDYIKYILKYLPNSFNINTLVSVYNKYRPIKPISNYSLRQALNILCNINIIKRNYGKRPITYYKS